MTPVVFAIAGIIFACTAATYTEATTMFPDAGGSSSRARRAFDLGVLWEPLGESPGTVDVTTRDVQDVECLDGHRRILTAARGMAGCQPKIS